MCCLSRLTFTQAHLVGIEITELSAHNDIDKQRSYDALFESFSSLLRD